VQQKGSQLQLARDFPDLLFLDGVRAQATWLSHTRQWHAQKVEQVHRRLSNELFLKEEEVGTCSKLGVFQGSVENEGTWEDPVLPEVSAKATLAADQRVNHRQQSTLVALLLARLLAPRKLGGLVDLCRIGEGDASERLDWLGVLRFFELLLQVAVLGTVMVHDSVRIHLPLRVQNGTTLVHKSL